MWRSCLQTSVYYKKYIILISFLLKQNRTNVVVKNRLQADHRHLSAVSSWKRLALPPNLPRQDAPWPLLGLPQATFTSKHTSTRLDPTQTKVLDVITAGRTQHIFTCVCNSRTTPKSTSAADMLLLDCTAHDGRTANSGSWMKKRNFFLKQKPVHAMKVYSGIKV
jgi:hypothetical protein